MKLEEIASTDPLRRSLVSALVVRLPSYKKDVADGLPFFSEEELAQIEAEDEELTFQQIKEKLASKGMILKPATFKRYLGLGVIPGTSRIQRTGKGNIGYYPARIIRDINLVKYALYANLSFEDLLKSSIDTYSVNLFEFIETLHPEALSPLIDWEADWDVLEIVYEVVGKLFDDGKIKRKEMESVRRKAAAYFEASSKHFKTQRELVGCLERLRVTGAYLLNELLQRERSSAGEEDIPQSDPNASSR